MPRKKQNHELYNELVRTQEAWRNEIKGLLNDYNVAIGKLDTVSTRLQEIADEKARVENNFLFKILKEYKTLITITLTITVLALALIAIDNFTNSNIEIFDGERGVKFLN